LGEKSKRGERRIGRGGANSCTSSNGGGKKGRELREGSSFEREKRVSSYFEGSWGREKDSSRGRGKVPPHF